jgi:hypothetical protein
MHFGASPMFLRNILPPSSGLKSGSSKKPAEAELIASFYLFFWLSYSSTLKVEAIYFSETQVNFCQTIWLYNAEDCVLFIFTAVLTSNPIENFTF